VTIGGALTVTDQIIATDKGIEFNESDTNPTCGAGNYTIYADTSETKLKKCVNGTVSDLEAKLGDSREQDFSTTGAGSTYAVPADAVMVIVEAWGGGGGGGGAASGNSATTKGGGGGGGGGVYVTKTFLPGDIGGASASVTVTAGAGGTLGQGSSGTNKGVGNNGSVGGNTTFGTFLTAYGGGGGALGAIVNGTGSGGGGGGGSASVGVDSTNATGGTGGNPLRAAANTNAVGSSGAGGGTSNAAGAAGANGEYGGGGGASTANNAAGDSTNGGSSLRGGAGGGAGGAIAPAGTNRAGGAGGFSPSYAAGGGGTAGPAGGASAGGVGNNGTTKGYGGGGGGGGGSQLKASNAIGAVGGDGGVPGGGAGGGGGGLNNTTATGGNGGTGGQGWARVYSIRGSNAADLAEIYSTNDADLKAGDVVSLDPTLRAGVKKSEKPYDPMAIGIISSNPSLIMGANEDGGTKSAMVALAGRVPVRVSAENGVIKPGDLLTSSSMPGVAMKATRAGEIIGQALTGYDGITGGGNGEAMVVAFIRTGNSIGSRLADLLPTGLIGSDANSPPSDTQFPGRSPPDLGKQILAYLINEPGHPPEGTDLSEIFTDRLAAALEVISPRVLTNTLVTNSIEPVDTGIQVKLVEGGKFTINLGDATGPPFVSFDDIGNAFFAGALTAGSFEVGNPEKPSGMTFYDTATGKPYCTRVTNGNMATSEGKCSEVLLSLPIQSSSTTGTTINTSPAVEQSGQTAPPADNPVPETSTPSEDVGNSSDVASPPSTSSDSTSTAPDTGGTDSTTTSAAPDTGPPIDSTVSVEEPSQTAPPADNFPTESLPPADSSSPDSGG
jgi:hypothetical protein